MDADAQCIVGSALVVEIPEADPVLGLLPASSCPAEGIPAHVTVLFPFAPPEDIDPALIARLAAVFATCQPFEYRFERLGWFGERVLWLAPADPAGFNALTDAVVSVFPTYQPYDGEFTEHVPHLTVGIGEPYEHLQAAATQLEAHLAARGAITGRASAVTLISIADGAHWTRVATLPLGGA